MRRARPLVLALGLALIAPSAGAQPADAPDDVPDEDVRLAPAGEGRREGAYGGVRPGVLPKNPSGRPVKGARPGTLTWVGFQPDGGVARIFLQSAGEVRATQRIEGKAIVLHLEGVRRLARNVRRPLDARFFDTPVARIGVKKVGARKGRAGRPARRAGYEVTITLKQGAAREVPIRSAVEADGMHYLYVDVAP
jgi:hypothetical protein